MEEDFKTFFMQATRCSPFPYQCRLADPTSELPELLQVPTGTGKTAAAVLSWLWRRKKRPAETPRKLVYCLPMRVLVEQTRTCAVLWLHRLGLLAGLAELDENDRAIRYEPAWGEPGKVAVATVMGGETADRWREHPESELLLVGTQDMLVSRALNRGYAAWPQEWPVEFGLLNIDSLWVMDEVQLMGPARTTSVQLQVFAEEQSSRRRDQQLPPRRTLWMSATMGASSASLDPPQWMRTPERGPGVLRVPVAGAREEGPKDENDLLHCDFAKRWHAPKHLELHVAPLESAASLGQRRPSRKVKIKDEASMAWTIDSDVLVERIVQEATSGPHRTVLVFVNRVDRARALFDRLSAVWPNDDRLLLLHARFRLRDRRVTERRLQEPAPRSGRIVVSTQVLEAGVDLDAHALFTEVCPWPSLVQRLGRLNRRGELSLAPAVVFDVPLPPRRDGKSAADYREQARRESSLPYEADELDITRSRLDSVSKQGGSVSPEALSKLSASIELAGPVLRRFDLDDLFDTDPDLAGGHTDVAPFVRALDRDVDAYVLWRRLTVPLDDQPPVHPDELCGVPFYEVREAFAGQNVWILSLATNRRYGAAWRRTRADEVRAGDTVMVGLSAGCYTEASGWLGKGQRARTPSSWIERWERTNGVFRAWARAGTSLALPSFTEEDIIDTHVDARRACGEDPRSYTKSWMELDHHLRKAEEHARDILETLRLPISISLAVCKAARWHDVGKALEREVDGEKLRPFQKMLLKSGYPEDGEPREGVLYAKSNRRGGPSAGFRHEVASALSYLARADADDLVAYLIIAHHGKVRLLPTPWDDDDPVDANGVQTGDVVPSDAIPETVNGESVRLDPSMFLASRSRSSWQGRIVRLLEELGPFGLAYLEALVRVADWRAS